MIWVTSRGIKVLLSMVSERKIDLFESGSNISHHTVGNNRKVILELTYGWLYSCNRYGDASSFCKGEKGRILMSGEPVCSQA